MSLIRISGMRENMVNQKQLALLKAGVKGWNAWRSEHPEARIDLTGASLSFVSLNGANLRGANLAGATLNEVSFIEADLVGAQLCETSLIGAQLNKADLSQSNLARSNLYGADLYEARLCFADLHGTSFIRANLNRTNLNGVNLSTANLKGAYLSEVDLSNVHLSEANLGRPTLGLEYQRRAESWIKDIESKKAHLKPTMKALLPAKQHLVRDLVGRGGLERNLSGADLSHSVLEEVDLRRAVLRGADLHKVNLSRADLSEADLSCIDSTEANLSKANCRAVDCWKANFWKSDLSEANFSKADLSEADLRRANLRKTNFCEANLWRAKLRRADLSDALLYEADLSSVNLRKANLSEANLSKANLSNADLSGANLRGINLCGAQVLNTNFSGAILTGACLKNWNTNSRTNLSEVTADYIYLDASPKQDVEGLKYLERRPHFGKFKPGEFAALFQQALDTLDLIFIDGIDWHSFFASLQELRQKYSDAELNIQTIERKSGGSFVVKLEVNEQADKAALQQSWNGIYEENQKLKGQLLRTEGKLEGYKEQLSDFQQKVLQGMADQNQTTIHNNFGDAKIGNFANTLSGNASMNATQNNYAADPKTPAEAAKEIHGLLVQLAKDNPLATDDDRAEHLRKTLPPTRLQRSVELIQTAGEAAVESLPGGKVVTAVLKKVREQEAVQRKAQD